MDDYENEERRGRGRPKGSKDKDQRPRLITGGENTRGLAATLRMWKWEKPDMTNPAIVERRVEKYFKLCLENDGKPSIEGLSYAFGVHRTTMHDWITGKGYKNMPEESREVLRRAYQVINVQMVEYMQNGKINPVSGIFMMKNNMGYVDTQSVTLSPNSPLGLETPAEDLRKKYLAAVDVETNAEGTENE